MNLPRRTDTPADPPPPRDADVRLLRALRRETLLLLGGDLAGDPVLDILLGLLLDSGAATPDPGAGPDRAGPLPVERHRRWMRLLEKRGWIEHGYDPRHPTCLSPKLSETARDRIGQYLARVAALLDTRDGGR